MIVAYLLEYYTKHAIEYVGWMITISKALPLLYKYHYGWFQFIFYFIRKSTVLEIFICETYNIYMHYVDDYAEKLFRKECFAVKNYFFDNYKDLRSVSTIKTRRAKKLQSTIDRVISKLSPLREFINEKLRKKRQFALRVVPLPDFTVYDIEQDEKSYLKSIVN